MPMFSYVHQLFNAEQCQASLQTRRGKERPRQGPRCPRPDVDPWGQYHDRPGCKRSWWHGGTRTCNDLTAPLLHRSQRAVPHGMLATLLRCLSCASRRIARALGRQRRPSARWCGWLRHAARS
jgi:hypothetical protein